MARGWHYTKLSLSSALLNFFLACACVIVPSFLSFLSCFCFVLFSCSRWSFVNKRSSDLFPVQQTTYRIGNHVYY